MPVGPSAQEHCGSPLNSTFPVSLGYPASTPQAFPQEQSGVLATSVYFQGVLPQKTPDFSHQYQQNGEFLHSQPKHYLQHHQTTSHEAYPSAYQSHSRKRQRTEEDMSLSWFSKGFVRHGLQEISPGSEHPDDDGVGRGPSLFQSLEQCLGGVCPANPGYETTTCKQIAG